MLTIYRRIKNEAGEWTAERVKEGRGLRTSGLTGPFFVRPMVNGKQERRTLHSTTFADARKEADEIEQLCEAQSKGLTVADLTGLRNANRTPVKVAVETYLELKKNKSPKTLVMYRLTLNEFLESLGEVKFLDQINVHVLRAYKDFLVAKGLAGRTIDTRVNIVTFLLKKNGILDRLPKDELPIVEEEPAVPYEETELKKLFGGMTEEQKIAFKFFLGSACRDREVTFAAWTDINFDKGTYTIRSKPEVGFTVKNHESRTVPLPDSLLKTLKPFAGKGIVVSMSDEGPKTFPNSRWIFVDDKGGGPANNFLHKLKRIALRAGLNCGQCTTERIKGKYKWRKRVTVTCKTDPVCCHIYLHRLRKTCATRWHEAGVPIRTIQYYLGHKSLETTMRYLGISDVSKVRDQINQAFGD